MSEPGSPDVHEGPDAPAHTQLEPARVSLERKVPDAPRDGVVTSVSKVAETVAEPGRAPDEPEDAGARLDSQPVELPAVEAIVVSQSDADLLVEVDTPPVLDTGVAGDEPSTPWRRLVAACKPHMSRAQLLAAVLCAVLGFALVVQLRQTKQDEFANLRQSDLVRILDDVTRRSEDLDRELSSLRKTEFELRSGTDSQQAALALAEQDATTQGILSGRLPAQGPGIEITIAEGSTKISASRMFNVLEELRNAGAEVVEVNGIRMVTSSYFVDADRGIVIDGIVATAPYRWAVIGDPLTLQPAMEIPGGALPAIRSDGGRTTIELREVVEVKAVREPEEPQFATPGVDGD